MEFKDSLFMKDCSRSNYGYEAMLDYQLSWLLRVAKGHPNQDLLRVARSVLFKLIGKKDSSGATIQRVEIWKQWERIDLTAEIEVVINDKLERHLVVIEDKAYTLIHDDQLTSYKGTINAYYRGKEYTKHFWVITYFEQWEDGYKAIEKQCQAAKEEPDKDKDTDWKLLSFYDVIEWKEGFKDTGSDLFDEFWLRKWS